MKIIFLDFDGVILTARTAIAYGQGWSRAKPDNAICEAIRRSCSFCEGGSAQIVLSTAWRDCEAQCREKLDEVALTPFLHPDWRTKDIPGGHTSRPCEIAEWLTRHPEVGKNYRILDDDDWSFNKEQAERFLKCCPMEGAGHRVIEALLKWAISKNRLP